MLHTQLILTMDYNAKSMAASNTPAVDINVDMDEVLKRIQVNIYLSIDISASKSSIRRFVITEKAPTCPTRAFS